MSTHAYQSRAFIERKIYNRECLQLLPPTTLIAMPAINISMHTESMVQCYKQDSRPLQSSSQSPLKTMSSSPDLSLTPSLTITLLALPLTFLMSSSSTSRSPSLSHFCHCHRHVILTVTVTIIKNFDSTASSSSHPRFHPHLRLRTS